MFHKIAKLKEKCYKVPRDTYYDKKINYVNEHGIKTSIAEE